MSGVAFGVHLGCTTISTAIYKDGKCDVVANDAGDRVTPAVIAFLEEEVTVGLPAKQSLFRHANCSVTKSQTLLGLESTVPGFEQALSACKNATTNKKGEPVFELEVGESTKEVSPDQAATIIYEKSLEITTHQCGVSDTSPKAVITAPLYFTPEQRRKLRQAAQKAGYNVLQVISEPSAALLSYNVGQSAQERHQKILAAVFNVGGVFTDATLVSVQGGMYRILSSVRKPIGGEQITQIAANFLAEEFFNKWKLDPRESKRAFSKLVLAAEEVKHVLSTLGTAHCFVESLCEGVDLSSNLSRARFEMLLGPLLAKLLEPLHEAAAQANLSLADVNKVVLCGGTTKIPRLQSAVRDAVPNSELLTSIPGDEVLAVGAATQASLLTEPWSQEQNSVTVPVISKDVWAKFGTNEVQTVFPAHTPLPLRVSLPVPIHRGEKTVSLMIGQEDKDLAKLELKNLPEAPSVAANFHALSDGSLHVTLQEKMTNVTASVTIEAAS